MDRPSRRTFGCACLREFGTRESSSPINHHIRRKFVSANMVDEIDTNTTRSFVMEIPHQS